MTDHAMPSTNDLAPVELRPANVADAEQALACHNAVFADAARGVPPRNLAHWRWKFAANPTGVVRQMLAVHPAAGVLGIYGTIPVHATFAGRRCLAGQAVDFCVRPEWLKHGGPPGLFPRLGRACLDRWLGSNDGQLHFLWGLPIVAWRSGAVHLGWQIARDWDITFRELPPGGTPRATPAELEVRAVERFDQQAEALFARVEPTLGVATVRDHRYLNWRYADHPDRAYVLFECHERRSGALRGLCVYGRGDVVRPNTSHLVDWLAPADDGDTTTALLAAAEQQTRTDGTGLLCAVWNPLDPRFLAMQELGYRVRGTPYFLVLAAALHDVTFFREQWYFTLGDSDLV
ncbi:MAG: hypothetical protein WAT39_25025 [Planctomycetota bacterium]